MAMRWLVLISFLAGTGARADDEPAPEVAGARRISVTVPHQYAREEALARLGYLVDYWHKAFDVRAEWRGDDVFVSGRIFGLTVQARLSVLDAEVVAIAADPGWLWRSRAEGYVAKKLKKYMHPTYQEP